ncbi:MAG TPA: bifunctional 4-hydroxy-2-oxoglutarate aldolase/2-dehydro-3-deoxy-phosphogluconate aldolase [Candidatus Aminicenantes bacterium]|nr:bifunctional 4-hydroxy-2-oxoglutarate aldolase/2-dehydro-3-deoxy-phosphogluconate aldolase [Candidatus Aminicenantes bacterium]HRY65108.1 bifunctional 4-hydroxy-2-oxoglutarate aldolase/2-dehydro-3-deoxy-phosphogluconate aldolase [Candidatus Aminicenantes bacterium]HRZ72021.1 bifunctional 4-hydroxy-2-oxoglutarate aldolase/2-dehydro-3-deoxy-phosphogluconate aldolase [Candidatus Aminicenantes bacterium]
MTRNEALEIILETKVIAVIRMAEADKLRQVVEAVSRGGVRAIEITMTTPGALDAIRTLAAGKPAGSLIGAGTVLDAATAAEVIRAGAEFVVSPVLDADMIRTCREADRFVAPGAFSPTEILSAWRLGADVVKVFPATSLGPKFFKDVRGPLPQIRIMPTGGVSMANASDFLEAGACCVGIGTALLDKEIIKRGDWEALTSRARQLVDSLARPAGPR